MIYTYAETLRMQGVSVGLISRITEAASRRRDKGSFSYGPVTLGLGAMLALMLYPEPAAAIAIYALAFGDGFSSLFGKIFGRGRDPLHRGEKRLPAALRALVSGIRRRILNFGFPPYRCCCFRNRHLYGSCSIKGS